LSVCYIASLCFVLLFCQSQERLDGS
jgi:hypothetical protein